jgi:uncharacterized protein DUF5317
VFLGVLFLMAVATVPLCGGRLSALAELHLRKIWLIWIALGAQILIISIVPEGAAWLHQGVHLATYAVAAVFAYLNRRVPGLTLAAAGGLANVAAIVANGGVMPASPSALRTAGFAQSADHFKNSTAVDDAHLQVLGDIFAIPASWPVHNVFSIGDVLLVLGVLVGLHVICASRPARALGLHPVRVSSVEVVDAGCTQALVRVSTVPHRGMDAGDLLVDDGISPRRLSPLPGSTRANGYAVPAALLGARTRLALALPNGALMDVQAPKQTSVLKVKQQTPIKKSNRYMEVAGSSHGGFK